MASAKKVILVLMALPFVFCLLVKAACAQSCEEEKQKAPVSTTTGNHEYPPGWSACIEAAVSPLVINGPENRDDITRPGNYQYTVSGAVGSYVWSVTGTEDQNQFAFSIDANGYVTLMDQSQTCGSYEVSVTDSCGRRATRTDRVNNAGVWHVIGPVYCETPTGNGCDQDIGLNCGPLLPNQGVEDSGSTKRIYAGAQYYCCPCNSEGPPSGGCGSTLVVLTGSGTGGFIPAHTAHHRTSSGSDTVWLLATSSKNIFVTLVACPTTSEFPSDYSSRLL